MLPLLKRSALGRMVNLSSGLGSLTQTGDASSEFAAFRFIGYGASKAALNMLTVQVAAELKDSGIKVNSADPGYTATDLNGRRGRQTISLTCCTAQPLIAMALRSMPIGPNEHAPCSAPLECSMEYSAREKLVTSRTGAR